MHSLKRAILAVSMGVGFAAAAQTPPKTPSTTNVAVGKELFHQHCSLCHGEDATGHGSWYDPNNFEPERRVQPADLTVLSERNAGKFPTDRVRDSIYSKSPIPAHGTPDMPAWGDVFYSMKSDPKALEQRVRDLTAYIESLQETRKQ